MPNILIVEDNVSYAAILAFILKEHGYRVKTAFTGKEAIDMVATENFDAIIVDHWMPDLNGIETIRVLRNQGCKSGVILLTALIPWEVENKIDGLDVWKIIEKSSVEKVILDEIQNAVEFTQMNKEPNSSEKSLL